MKFQNKCAMPLGWPTVQGAIARNSLEDIRPVYETGDLIHHCSRIHLHGDYERVIRNSDNGILVINNESIKRQTEHPESRRIASWLYLESDSRVPVSIELYHDAVERLPDAFELYHDAVERLPDAFELYHDTVTRLRDTVERLRDTIERLTETTERPSDTLTMVAHGGTVPTDSVMETGEPVDRPAEALPMGGYSIEKSGDAPHSFRSALK